MIHVHHRNYTTLTDATNADRSVIMAKHIWTALVLLACSACDNAYPLSATGDAGQIQQSAAQISPELPSPSSNFKRVNLPRGVSLDVPKGWWALDDEFTQMLHTSTEAVMDLTRMPLQEGAETDLIRANSMPKSTFAAVAVTSIVPPSGQPDELRALESAELSELAGYIKVGLRDVLVKQGWQLLGEVTVQVGSMSGYPALISEYRRTGPKGSVFVQIIQIMTGKQEVKITLSFREKEATIWRSIIEKIRRSIVVNEHPIGNL